MSSRGRSVAALLSCTITVPVAAAAPAVAPLAIECTATGLKYFATGVSAEQICQRFVRSFGRARGATVAMRTVAPGRSGLHVEIGFRPPGIASARVVEQRAGKSLSLPLYELAVSDRKFLSSDIDRLAVDVARGLTGALTGGPARIERD